MLEQQDIIRKAMNRMGNESPFLFVLDYELQKPLLVPLSQAQRSDILYDFSGIKNCGSRQKLKHPPLLQKHPVSFHRYKKAFDVVMENLKYGNTFLLNLTMPTVIETNLSLEEIFNVNKQAFRLWIKDRLVVFSPESFVSIKQGIIRSFPMKGTIDASLKNAESRLLSDPKEMAEHATIVDLIRNDLSTVASDVKVERYRYVEKVKTSGKDLLQVSTEISGRVPDDWKTRIGDIVMPLLPAGSISGAPKPQTLKIIEKAEGAKRGYYTGVMGVFDGEQLVSAVMIRYVEQKNGQLIYRSGGGITAQSDAQSEYQEMIDKVYLPR